MPGFAIAGSRLQGHPWPWAAASLKSNSPCDCHLCVTCHSVSGPLPLAARKPKAKWCLAVGPVFFQFLAASAMEDLSCSSLCRCFPRSSRIYEPALQDMSFHRRSTLSSRTVPKYQDGLEWTCSQRHHERSSLLVGGWTTTNININIYIYVYLHILRCICNCRHSIMVCWTAAFKSPSRKVMGRILEVKPDRILLAPPTQFRTLCRSSVFGFGLSRFADICGWLCLKDFGFEGFR